MRTTIVNLSFSAFIIFILALTTPSLFAQSLQNVFHTHNAVMLIIDADSGEIIDANSAAEQFYGRTLKSLKTMQIQDINLLSEEQVAVERELAQTENRSYFIFRHKVADDKVKTVAVYARPITYQGKNALFSIIQDIDKEREFKEALWHYKSNLEHLVDSQVSEIEKAKKQQVQLLWIGLIVLLVMVIVLYYLLCRKKAAEEKQLLLEQIVEQSPIPIQTTNEEGKITYVNKKFASVTGYSAKYLIGKSPSLLKSGKHNVTLYDELWETISKGEHWVGEFFNRKKSGENFWERANIYPLMNKKNKISSYVAIKEDITQAKENEKTLRLASAVFETAAEAVMVTDADNKIIAINHAFTQITGYSEEEVIGQDPAILSSGHHEVDFYRQMKNELLITGQWQGEICNRKKNGEVFYEWLSIKTLRDDTGKLESYVSIFSDITKRKQAEDKIYLQAHYDSLTGLANRNLFIDRLQQHLSRAKRDNTPTVLLFIDLDGFKGVNDTFGHSIGDELLKLSAKRIKSSLRDSDTVCRLSGDEFAAVVVGDNDVFSVEKIASKILAELAKPFIIDNNEAYVTASIGISMAPEDGENTETLLSKADNAMYKAKRTGKNNIQFYTKDMDEKAQKRRMLEIELRKAILQNEFTLFFQPIHDITSNRVSSAEALIRWEHPDRGIISPGDFIPVAENIGVITEIGDWVLQEACAKAKQWLTLYKNPPKVSVNISSSQLHRQDFLSKLKLVLDRTELPPEYLVLEMTESLLIEEDKFVLTQLKEIREMGIELSIDDFGTGYSSLSYLKRFPVSILKIDRAFIKDILVNPEDEALACAILSIAKSLKLKVVAEGVEKQAQKELLSRHGCNHIQGYYLSPPISYRSFVDYMDNHYGSLHDPKLFPDWD
ncbi:EAL domain-containing protein [Thalassotalea loyana]|nr:EAL domain-containing protein [Thalassotalea loyana]